MTRIIIESDPVRVLDEAGQLLKEFSSKDPHVIHQFIAGKANLFICNDPVLFKQLSDLEHGLVKGTYKRPGEDMESLPEGYIFSIGKYKGKTKEEVPKYYSDWFQREIPRNKW